MTPSSQEMESPAIPGRFTHQPRPGPEPERLEVEGDWEEAVERALKKPRPKEGWPSPEEMQERKEKKEKRD